MLESGEEKFIYKKDGKEYELRIQDAMKEFGSRYDELNLKNDLNKAFLKALDKLKIGYEVLENAPVRIRFLKQNKPEQSKTSANNPALWKIQRDMGVRLKELKAQVKENNERYKNEYKALQKELTNTKDLFKSFEKEFNETKGTILISRAKRRKNDAEGKVETSVFLGNELALRNALDRWETYSGYSKENALEVKERLELLKSYVKRLEKHRKDIRAKREQLEQDYRQKNAPLDREISVIRYYKILRNSKGMSDTELYEPFLENTDGYLSKEAFNEGLPRVREEFQKLFNITPLKEFGTNYAEFYKDGKGAIQKLLAEKQGQVSGAFYKEGLGDIDLVWGDDSFGLKHILDKHGGEFEDIAEKLDKIIQNGEVVKRKGRDEAYNIEYKGFKVGINKGFNKQGGNKWVVTAFNDNIEKTAKTAPANDSTKGASLPLNSKQSIAQNSEKLPFEMQVLAEDKLSGDEVRHLANKIGEKTRTMAYFKDYLLKMDRDFHARAKDIIREYYKIEPFRKELENQWANVKEAYNKGEMSLKEFKFLSKYKDEGDFLNQVAQTLWHHNDELVKNRGYTINGYGQIERGKGGNYYQNLALEYDGALKSLKKWFYYIQKANKQAQRFFNKKMKTTKDIIKEAKEQGLSVKQAQKAVDENKLYKSLNESLKAGWDFFKANNKDDYNDKLFNNVIRVANDLDVRFWYQPNAKWMNGSYTYALNRIMLRSDFQTSSNAKTMLHELIHGVTSRAIYAYEDKIFRQKLSKEQIEGIEELKKLFKEVLDKNEAKAWKKAGNFKAEVELNEGANTLYGLRDEHEFLAELANPQFRSFLKEQNLFAQIIEAMAKIFSYVKEKLSGKVKSVSAKEELEGILYKIMDNYNNPHEFSTQMSEYFGSRNFVDIKRFKDYIKNNKEQFDKDNGKYPFKFFDNSKLSNAEKDAFKGKAEYEEVMDRDARIWREDDDLLALWLRSKDERIMPNYPNPLYEDERQILKNHKEQSYLKDLKNAVENYYKVNYDEFNNAFNGAFKDKHFFKAKKGDETRDKRGVFIYNASDDVKFLLALKPYFESGLYKILDENDFKRIRENIIRILKEEHLKYRNKPLNEWLAKEWVEKDVANLLEAKASPFTQKQELENKEANVHTLREQTKEFLSALVGKNITNQNDGRIASISRKNIMKMTSDKAIQKSVNNGFTPQEHFKAVQDIESLYQAAVLKETHADRKSNNPNVFIHRYTADFNGNNALITIKESLDNNSKGNKIYTLELEALELKPSAPEPQGSITMSKNTGYAEPVTPNETHKSIIPQRSINLAMEKFHYDEAKAKDLLEWHKDSSPLTKDENGLPKVFYHGTGQKEFDPLQNKDVNFEVFKTTLSNQDDDFLKGHYFSSNIKIAKTYTYNNNIYKVFLNAKNPLVIDFKGHTFNDYIDEAIDNIPKSVQENIRDFYDSIIFKNIIDDSTQNGKKHPVADTIMVFNSNQIKHINNKGSYTDTKGNITKNKPKNSEAEHKYFNEKSENIYYSNPHLGAGLVGGSLNGVEQDEEGNLSFDPAKFAMGFLGGTIGSKAVSKGIEWRANKVKKAYPNIAKDNPALMEQIAKRDLLTYAKNESANALTRFLNKNKLFDSTRGLFAGEKALLNEAYAPHKARLKEAKALESNGADEIEIWEKTGWYKDKDKKWKFEISQRGGEFKWDLLKKVGKDMLSEDRSMRLEEVLQDDALFRAYPQLKELKIRAVEIDDSVLGQYSEVKKNIMLSPDLNSMRAKRTLYHELQHAVQDIEGFAYGDKWELRKNYKLRHGEVEARNVENRLLTRKNDLKKLDKEIQKLTKEIQNEESAELGDYEKFSLALKKRDLVDMLEFKDKILSLDDEIIKKHPHKTMDTPLSETIAESTIQGEALSKELESENMDLKITKEKDFFKNLRNNAKNYLKNLKGKIVENENNGLKASISSEGINKMISVKSVDKSIKNGYTKEEHFKAVENVLNLFKISQFVRSEKANNGSVDIINYHKFNADFSINKKPSRAKITIKESYEGGNKIYSLELLELQRASK
ncbi:conserved hypothetical protein [Campylobacter upsaliensis RM3195]|nr:conserved hypothetical protein [Campylobacter upsaliensis RM3195]